MMSRCIMKNTLLILYYYACTNTLWSKRRVHTCVCVCVCFECVVFGVILLLNATILIHSSPAYLRKRIFASCRPRKFRFLYNQECY